MEARASAQPRPPVDLADGAGSADLEVEHRWLVRVWVLVAAFAAVAVVRSVQLGIPFRDPRGDFFLSKVPTTLSYFVALVVVDAVRRTARGSRTRPRELAATLRRRWPLRRLGLALGGLLAWHLVYFCYHNLKSWDVFQAPHDTALLRTDRWLFAGHDPAVLLHSLLGEGVAAHVLAFVYQAFPKLEVASLAAAVALPSRMRDGYVFVTAALWAWILGTASYYLVPSLGPFHSAPADFAGLPPMGIQRTQALYVAQRDHLLAHPHAADAAAQISAFASLHVAVTAMVLLMARWYGLRRTSRVLAVWLAATILATVYLGWHYAVDDVAGLLIAIASVRLGRSMILRRPGE